MAGDDVRFDLLLQTLDRHGQGEPVVQSTDVEFLQLDRVLVGRIGLFGAGVPDGNLIANQIDRVIDEVHAGVGHTGTEQRVKPVAGSGLGAFLLLDDLPVMLVR